MALRKGLRAELEAKLDVMTQRGLARLEQIRVAELDEVREWAVPLVAKGATVLHLGTGVVGKVVKLYEPGEDVPGSNGRLSLPCLGLDTGDVLLAEPEAFLVLTKTEATYFERASSATGLVVAQLVEFGASMARLPVKGCSGGMTLPRALQLLSSVLAAQLRQLRATGAQATPDPE